MDIKQLKQSNYLKYPVESTVNLSLKATLSYKLLVLILKSRLYHLKAAQLEVYSNLEEKNDLFRPRLDRTE